MKKSIIQILIAGLAMSLAGAASACAQAIAERINRAELEEGGFNLGLFVQGERDGFMRFGWYTDADGVHLWDRSMIISSSDYESFAALLDPADLTPLTVELRYHSGIHYYLVDAAFADEQVSGTRSLHGPGEPTQSQPIDHARRDGVIVRGAVFMLAPVLDLEPGDSVSFDWWVPLRDVHETVRLTATSVVTIETPAGPFEAILIEQRGGTPGNDIYVDTETGRVVRIDVVGRPVQYLALPDQDAAG
ncbi:hypothetical protein [Maricaulis sp.]|uniref:hypothetical protein n=1 Tax=Maricaulis sp. TaxID=1486257 RepID=UPI003A93A54F